MGRISIIPCIIWMSFLSHKHSHDQIFCVKAGSLKKKQPANTLKIRILSQTSKLYLMRHALVILIGGPVKAYANKQTLLEEKLGRTFGLNGQPSENWGAHSAWTGNLWITVQTLSQVSFVGRNAEWDINFYYLILYSVIYHYDVTCQCMLFLCKKKILLLMKLGELY